MYLCGGILKCLSYVSGAAYELVCFVCLHGKTTIPPQLRRCLIYCVVMSISGSSF